MFCLINLFSFRSLADAEFKKEAKNAQDLEEYQKKQPKKGFMSRLWGSSSTPTDEVIYSSFTNTHFVVSRRQADYFA